MRSVHDIASCNHAVLWSTRNAKGKERRQERCSERTPGRIDLKDLGISERKPTTREPVSDEDEIGNSPAFQFHTSLAVSNDKTMSPAEVQYETLRNFTSINVKKA